MEHFFRHIENSNYDKAYIIADKSKEKELSNHLKTYLKIIQNGVFPGIDSTSFNNDSPTLENNIRLINIAITQYAYHGDEVLAFKYLRQSLKIAKKRKDKVLVCQSLKYILEIYERFHVVIEDMTYNIFIQEYEKYAYNEREKSKAALYKYRISQRFNFKNIGYILSNYKKARNNLNSLKSPYFQAKRDLTHYVHHQDYTKDADSCKYFLDKTFRILKNQTGYFENERKIAAKINKASLQLLLKKPQKAISILDSININGSDYLTNSLKKFISFKKHLSYEMIGDALNSCKYFSEYMKDEMKANQADNLQIVSEYETKYQTAEKEKQILLEQQRTRKNRNWLVASIALLIFGGLTALLIQKNTTKKRKLAEQNTLLEQQKVTTLLKEQELTAIDAMISGQEKERQRVANELHDDLGSLMATIKLHFENIKGDTQDPALKSASKLLEKAYQKIRGIAHSKNSGLMADQGLLPAIKKMAKTISETNALQVSVADFGLEERMENSLELTIFRIVQELIANIITHAGATEASIQFTQHEDKLNIIVEDNGRGFDMTKVSRTSNGMGLGTIEKRIEHLEGSFTVDSILGKGTSILIDIPI